MAATETISKSAIPGSVITSRRSLHLALMAILLVGHTFLHYAVLIPGVGETFGKLPFFNLHIIHEAEYLVVIAYASLVFRLRGGLIALMATLVASIPFLTSPHFWSPGNSIYSDYGYAEYGPSGPGNQIIDVAVIFVIGVWIVFVNEMWGRERDKRTIAYQELENANKKLEFVNQGLQNTNQQLDNSNRQLTALNQTVQNKLNNLFGTVVDLCEKERASLNGLSYQSDRLLQLKFIEFTKRIENSIRSV